MILEKENPVALDVVIHRIQKDVDKAFDVAWSELDTNNNRTEGGIICFPRCYVNFKKDNKFIIYNKKLIEHFDSETEDDYIDIVDAESNKMIVLAGYDIDYPSDTNGRNFMSTYIDLIFIVDLKQIYPQIAHRADQEVRSEVTKILKKIPNCTIHRVVTGLNRVFGELEYPASIDLQPKHCFKVVLKVERFSENEKYCLT